MKKSSRYSIILLLALVSITAQGQQLPIFSQYVLNGFIVNPAMAGHDGYTSVNTTARQQWVGFGDAPQTFSATWQTRILQRSHRIVKHPIRNKNILIPSSRGRVGLGAYVINDVNGKLSRTGIQFTYAYHIILENNQLSFGLAGKLFQFRIATDELEFGRDYDPLVNAGIHNVGYTPDVDFGIHVSNKEYFFGASISNLFQSVVNLGGITNENKIYRHYWLMGGYRFDMGKNFIIEPNAIFKTTEQWIPQGDIGAKVYYMDDYWLGVAFRTDGSLISLMGFNTGGFYFGYAYDYAFTSIQRFNFGTHELSLSYKFGDESRRYRWLRRY
ncbi:MAG: type IX secretion system membrane protein PorP/SprF [Bacteroidales bacterium]